MTDTLIAIGFAVVMLAAAGLAGSWLYWAANIWWGRRDDA